MDPSRRHLLASLPFVPGALGEWLVSWNYGTPVALAARQGAGRVVGLADVARIVEAQRAFGQALRLAKSGDDPLTGAWVLATLTRQAIHLEQGAWAVWLARAAVDTARRAEASPHVMALMLVREAWATDHRG
ncbi:hypothetical protein ACSDR0_07065 [Streptosporangium sp. G11]|uniref:hypothetical protein n=1 Tax=Streptosporangium sp. G11 TaxID=3436926 RepID=UPI003EBE746E